MQVKLIGLASHRTQIIEVTDLNLSDTILEFLRSHQIPVASSCEGQGVCKKCVIQNDWLSCKLTLKDFFQRQPDGIIKISYL